MKSTENSKFKRKNVIFGCGCLLPPFLLLLLLAFGTTFYNNFLLWRLERNFAALPHPAASKFVRREKFIGLIGNGNHCDFVVAELRSYDKSEQIRGSQSPTKRTPLITTSKMGCSPSNSNFYPRPYYANIAGNITVFSIGICLRWRDKTFMW